MLPITELRASIPIGVFAYGLHPFAVWLLAVLGNITPTIVLLLVFPRLHNWLIAHPLFGGVVKKRLQKAERVFAGKYAAYGAAALVAFVAVPLPFTGAWTGSLAAFVFGIPFRRSFPLIALGVCIAATVVTLVTLFAGGAVRFLL